MNILITGADKGLGLSLVSKYLKLGHCVFAALYKEPSSTLLDLKAGFGEKLQYFTMDVSLDDSVESARSIFCKGNHTIDILINNAGVHFDASYKALEEVDFEVALSTLNINSLGPLRVVKAFLPFVEKGSFKVIANISSEAGSISASFREKEFDYCMSKAALNMQSVILQKYVMAKKIKVLAIHPGWMRTDMGGEKADIDADTAAEGIVALINQHQGDLEGPIYMDYKGDLLQW